MYKITNVRDGKFYVGQHVKDDLTAYLKYNAHIAIRLGYTDKPRLYNALRKYGRESFIIESLVCPVSKEQMDMLEEFFIRTCESQNPAIGYNIAKGALPKVIWTPEMRKAAKKRAALNPAFCRRGTTHTAEAKQKNRQKHVGKPRDFTFAEWVNQYGS